MPLPLALSKVVNELSRYLNRASGNGIGADLLNLGKVQGLGAPIVSIGGAGTFDGIFLTAE